LRGQNSPRIGSSSIIFFLPSIICPLSSYNRMLPINLLESSATSLLVYLYLLLTSLFTIRSNTLIKFQKKRLIHTNLFTNKSPLDKKSTNLINPLKSHYIKSLRFYQLMFLRTRGGPIQPQAPDFVQKKKNLKYIYIYIYIYNFTLNFFYLVFFLLNFYFQFGPPNLSNVGSATA